LAQLSLYLTFLSFFFLSLSFTYVRNVGSAIPKRASQPANNLPSTTNGCGLHTMPNMWKTAATAAGEWRERKLCAETAPPAPSFLLFDFYGEHKKIK
jgi:hypothetical protein